MFQRFFAAAWAAVSSLVARVRRLIKHWGWRKTSIGAAIIVILLLVVYHFSAGSVAEVPQTNDTRTVTVASVGDLTSQTGGLSVSGIVSSKSEASVRAEKAGEITSLNYQLGDNVGAGAVVAEIENASERAAVLQAQAGIEAAQASSNTSSSDAVSTLLSAYAAIDNAVNNVTDRMFVNPESTPHTYILRINTTNGAAKRDAESLRSQLDAVLERQARVSQSISSTQDLGGELTQTENELRQKRAFLDALLAALNEAKPDLVVTADVLAGYKSDTISARTSVTASLSAVGSARQDVAGGTRASASSAALTQAQATLASARANLEHTIIRAPISGTINSLSLKRGDYVQQDTSVLTVANNNALEIVAYVTQSDAQELAVGTKAMLQGGIEGTVTRIAPAIDPATKKIEVRIGLTDPNHNLVNGQSVTIELARTTAKPSTTPTPSRLIIPLAAIKIGPDGVSVFTLTASSTLEANPVEIGQLLGDRVVVTQGLTPDMRIVTDARGLHEGEVVRTQ